MEIFIISLLFMAALYVAEYKKDFMRMRMEHEENLKFLNRSLGEKPERKRHGKSDKNC